jgi:molybdenum cofactor cytidylyltransferase
MRSDLPDGRSVARLSAIVLAAGLSRRMGGANKLLLPFSSAPLVRTVVSTIAGLPFAEVVVATGHEAGAVEAALADLPVRLVRNPSYEQGQMTTVRAALTALKAPCEGVMVCLGDQPALTSSDIELIADAFFASSGTGGDVLVPTFRGARGNPIVLARASLDAILARGGNFGCRQFVAKNADVVRTFEMLNDHVLVDVDRPEDYVALCPTAPPPSSPTR